MESPVAFLSIRQLLQSDTTRLHGRTTLCVANIESQAARGTLVCVSRSEPWHSVHKAQGEMWGRGLGDWHERETECWGGGGGGGGDWHERETECWGAGVGGLARAGNGMLGGGGGEFMSQISGTCRSLHHSWQDTIGFPTLVDFQDKTHFLSNHELKQKSETEWLLAFSKHKKGFPRKFAYCVSVLK